MTARASFLAFAALILLASLAPGDEASLAQRARTHWAFQPVKGPTLPPVADRRWVKTPIDAFILARLEKAGLQPTPAAKQRVLLRRVYQGLIGLPPTPEEMTAFLDDTSADAFGKLVDRLLADPRHGERWGRFWLDVARYADTNGYERDGDKPFAWRYRDYVIDALNRDLPFDQFLREQIAGDELPGSDARTQIATTFLRLGTWDDEPANDAVDRYDQLDDVLGVTATAFLAQTIRCARCHDHKFEPVSQKEYYQLLAVFEPLKRPQQGRTDLTRPVGTRAELDDNHRSRAALAELERRSEEILGRIRDRIFADATAWPAEVQVAFRTPADKRSAQQNLVVNRHQKPFNEALKKLGSVKERDRLDSLKQQREQVARTLPEPPSAYIWFEDGPKVAATRLLRRGNPNLVGAPVEVGLPAVLAAKPRAAPIPLERSTGRRTWLAGWMTSPENPLTARVIVNRVWQWHFGTGLVKTPSDFGLAGDTPSHPELLDWLATEFVRSGWSLKHLHRLIVLSSTYQTSSASDGPDAGRKLALFGRWKQRRLEAEAVRDSILAVSGQLNAEAFGPGVYPTLPPAVLATQSRPGLGWGKSDAWQSSRRSVYVFSKRSLALPELELLDAPDSTSSCEQRPMSTTAPQALTFLNGAFTIEQASHFADRLYRECGDDAKAQVRRAFALALSRAPEAAEETRILAFLEQQARQILSETLNAKPQAEEVRRRALASFCLVLFNSSEFFYPG